MTEQKLKIKEIIKGLGLGYEYRMSDYATSTKQEQEMEKEGLEALDKAVDEIVKLLTPTVDVEEIKKEFEEEFVTQAHKHTQHCDDACDGSKKMTLYTEPDEVFNFFLPYLSRNSQADITETYKRWKQHHKSCWEVVNFLCDLVGEKKVRKVEPEVLPDCESRNSQSVKEFAYDEPKYAGWYCPKCVKDGISGFVAYNASQKDIDEHNKEFHSQSGGEDRLSKKVREQSIAQTAYDDGVKDGIAQSRNAVVDEVLEILDHNLICENHGIVEESVDEAIREIKALKEIK